MLTVILIWIMQYVKSRKCEFFSDEADKMNLSVQDIQGEILSISQFTLYAETKKKGIVRAFLQQVNLILQKQCMKNLMIA